MFIRQLIIVSYTKEISLSCLKGALPHYSVQNFNKGFAELLWFIVNDISWQGLDEELPVDASIARFNVIHHHACFLSIRNSKQKYKKKKNNPKTNRRNKLLLWKLLVR